jgi:hypothetical protein
MTSRQAAWCYSLNSEGKSHADCLFQKTLAARTPSVPIQVSGAFGSRQEEAQRLGRVLRPKHDGRAARFFTLVSRDTREEEFAHHRKLFLTEQGYSYQVHLAEELSKAR